MRDAAAVMNDHVEALMAIPGVVGVYEGLCGDAPCLRIMVRESADSLIARLAPGELPHGTPRQS